MSIKITTDLMREWYVRADHSGNKSRAQYEREFDEWLDEHDRQVAERALRQALNELPLPDEDARSGMIHARGLIAALIVRGR